MTQFAVSKTYASGDAVTITNLNGDFDDVENFINAHDTMQSRKILICNWNANTADATTQTTYGVSFNAGGTGSVTAGKIAITPNNAAGVTEFIMGTQETDTFNYDADVYFSGVMKLSNALDANMFAAWGISSSSSSGGVTLGFYFGDDRATPDSKLYGTDGSGTVELTGVTVTNFNLYTAVHRAGVGTTFYVNGVSKGTLSSGSITTGTAVAKIHAEITQVNSVTRTGTFLNAIGINKIV